MEECHYQEWRISGVTTESGGWRLENHTCRANVRTHYRKRGGELLPQDAIVEVVQRLRVHSSSNLRDDRR